MDSFGIRQIPTADTCSLVSVERNPNPVMI